MLAERPASLARRRRASEYKQNATAASSAVRCLSRLRENVPY